MRPDSSSACTRVSISGWAPRSSHAQVSAAAVVSCPARKMVITVLEGQVAHVGHRQIGVDGVAPEAALRDSQQGGIDVHAGEAGWCEAASERTESDTATTAHLEYPTASRDTEDPKHQWDLEVFLPPVASTLVGERPVSGL